VTHIKSYVTQDGKVVVAHEDKRPTGKNLFPIFHKTAQHPQAPPLIAKMAEKMQHPEPSKEPGKPKWMRHPKKDEQGKPVYIQHPHEPTGKETWSDPKAIATFIPGEKGPVILNGVLCTPWEDHPEDPDDWNDVQGNTRPVDEPPLPETKKDQAAGVVIEESDGRVWVIHPSNEFGGYKGTFPKGHTEEGIDLQPSAIKEAYEESGLKVEITGFLCDVERTTTQCRYYTAKRIGGTPADAGWESQAVSLVPRAKLYEVLNMPQDHGTAEKLGAGPRPKIPPKPAGAYAPFKPTPWW
jgi:ADP-ribose pyrophosphatase YjhB (NUDIX family)